MRGDLRAEHENITRLGSGGGEELTAPVVLSTAYQHVGANAVVHRHHNSLRVSSNRAEKAVTQTRQSSSFFLRIP